MELRHLRYFLAVADAAHFTKAAQKLWVSQPTLSQQIKHLEDELGAPLFHRGSGGVQLTAAGEKFRPYAERALREMEAAVAALGEAEPAPNEQLKVGALAGTAGYLLPQVVARAVLESRLRISVISLPEAELEEAVSSATVDVAVGALPLSSGITEPLYDEDLALWTPSNHRLAGRGRVRAAELDGLEIFCEAAPSPLRVLLDDATSRANIQPLILAEFPDTESTLLAALAANLPAVLPAPLLQFHPALKGSAAYTAVALTNPRPHRTIALLRRKGREENPAVRVFVAHLNAVVSQLLKPE